MLNSDDTLSGQANAVGAWKKTFSTVTPLSQISQRCFKYMYIGKNLVIESEAIKSQNKYLIQDAVTS